MRNGRLQGLEAVIERQQGMLAEGNDDRIFALAQKPSISLNLARSPSTGWCTLVEVLRLHLTTVFGLIPWRRASALMLSRLHCIARRIACVVLALP